MLTELDITNKEFKRDFRGYSQKEVDEFLEELAETITKLKAKNTKLEDKIKNMEDREKNYLSMEANLQEALVLANKVSVDTKNTANKEADLIRKEAEQTAMRIIREAKDETYKAEQKLSSLKQSHEAFKLEIEQFYRTELAKLKAL